MTQTFESWADAMGLDELSSECASAEKAWQAALRQAIAQPEACTWTQTDDEDGIWSSSCGELWSFIDGGPKENRVSYCHHCGKKVEVKP